MRDHRPITVVVPVYGDAESLEKCLLSVLEHTDFEVHTLLVVNDCGPDADALEALVLRTLGGRKGTRYERNGRNLGFVATCNRAVLELDSSRNDVLLLNSDTVVSADWIDGLIGALAVDSSVGIVCPRSNNASLASFPPRTVDGRRWPTDESRSLHQELAPLLPEVTISPVAVGFCFLVRREVIDSLGLFDEAFSPGYGEENDLCRRALGEGWKSALANRVFVEHAGAASFSSARKDKLARDHERLLRRRHPDYWDAVLTFERVGRHPLDMFAGALVGSPSPRVLVFCDFPTVTRAMHAISRGVPKAVVTLAVPSWQWLAVRLLFGGRTPVIRHGDELGRVWHAATTTLAVSDIRTRLLWSAPQVPEIEDFRVAAQVEPHDLTARPAFGTSHSSGYRELPDIRRPGLAADVRRRLAQIRRQ